MDMSKWLEWIKLPTKTLAGLCIVFAIMIFSSDGALDRLGLASVVTEYRPYLGVGFLVSLSGLRSDMKVIPILRRGELPGTIPEEFSAHLKRWVTKSHDILYFLLT
jgi:hypothetical protein